MLRYIHETCHLDLIKLRNDMREQGLVPRKRCLDFPEEKDEEVRRKIRCREGPPAPKIERQDQYDGLYDDSMGGIAEKDPASVSKSESSSGREVTPVS